MTQQGKQMRVGACEGFAYHSVKLASLANSDRYEVDSNTFLLQVKNPIAFQIRTILTPIRICSRL
jgi:hypothetical protein